MNDKLANIPIDEEATVLAETRATLERHECVYQMRIRDGVRGESLLFAEEDVANCAGAQLEDLARNSPLARDGSQIKISRGERKHVSSYTATRDGPCLCPSIILNASRGVE